MNYKRNHTSYSMANSRFAVATHILIGIALGEAEGPVSSDDLAKSVNTNPVVVRRIIQDLTKSGLLRSKMGKGGGSELARTSDKITLNDVYQAVKSDHVFTYNPNPPNKKCPLSCKMKEVLEPIFANVDNELEKNLGKIKLSDLVKKIKLF